MKKLSLEEINEQRLTPEAALTAGRLPVTVLLDNIRSLYNVGSIFRSADAARVEKLLLSGITGSPPRKEIDKTALGAVETVPWEYQKSAHDSLKQMKSEGVQIVALEHTSNSRSYWDADLQFPCCLLLGSEVWGVQDEYLGYVDSAIEIPMYGAKHSLNVSVAFGICIYEMLQRYIRLNPQWGKS